MHSSRSESGKSFVSRENRCYGGRLRIRKQRNQSPGTTEDDQESPLAAKKGSFRGPRPAT